MSDTQPVPALPPVDPDAGSDYEQLCNDMLIDPFELSADIKAGIQALLPPPTPTAGAAAGENTSPDNQEATP